MTGEPLAIERVLWLDSTSLGDGGWIHAEEAREDDLLSSAGLVHESVGYVVAESKLVLVLAGARNAGERDVNEDTRFAAVVAIPKAAVLDRAPLVARRPR